MKKIELKKVTISNLSSEQMKGVQGATLFMNTCLCNDTESCSLHDQCCDPPPELRIETQGTVEG